MTIDTVEMIMLLARALLVVALVGTAACTGSTDSATVTAPTTSPVSSVATSSEDIGATALPPLPPTTTEAGPTDWHPILASTRATDTPPAAICDDRATADAAGSLSTASAGSTHNRLRAVFDSGSGSIVVSSTDLVDGVVARGSTWRLDVCDDSWTELPPPLLERGELAVPESLVYDVDSDRIVAFGESVWVFDPLVEDWIERPDPVGRVTDWMARLILSAAYHDPSGLIVASERESLGAYDVDMHQWTPITTDSASLEKWGEMLGYVRELDRLVFTSAEPDARTTLVDPATGEATIVQTRDTPFINLGWPNASFGSAAGTTFVTNLNTSTICGFDPVSLTWSRCSSPHGVRVSADAIVDDPINDRVVVVSRDSGLWAVDPDDEWTHWFDAPDPSHVAALPSATTTTLPDESLEYRPGARLTVVPPVDCMESGNPVVMTGGPGSWDFTSFFSDRGYVVVSVGWRDGGSGYSVEGFATSVDDLAVAVRWVRANAAELCADPDRIAAVGYSYGAITSLLLAYTHGELDPGEFVSVDEVGVAGELSDQRPEVPDELVEFSDDLAAVVGFAGFVLPDTIDPGEPPCLLFNGRNDGTIAFELAEATVDAAVGAGIACELIAHDEGHSMAEDVPEALDLADQFLREHLDID